jgi:hypothetical protein
MSDGGTKAPFGARPSRNYQIAGAKKNMTDVTWSGDRSHGPHFTNEHRQAIYKLKILTLGEGELRSEEGTGPMRRLCVRRSVEHRLGDTAICSSEPSVHFRHQDVGGMAV